MTTLSQQRGSKNNISLSNPSTPRLKNDSFLNSKNQKFSILNRCLKNETQKSYQRPLKSKIKPQLQEQQVKNSNLFLTKQEFNQNDQQYLLTFNPKFSQIISPQTGCTPTSLLQKLKNHNDQKENYQKNKLQKQSYSFTPSSNFSLITAMNPAFRRLEQIKRQRMANLTRSGLGWRDKSLYEDKGTGQLYKIPEQFDPGYIRENSFKKQDKNLQTKEKINQEQSFLLENFDAFAIVQSKHNKMMSKYLQRSLIERVISQPDFIEPIQLRAKIVEQVKELCIKSEKKSQKIDAQIQTDFQIDQFKESGTQDLGKLSFQQLSDEIMNRLKIIEEINNTQSSQASFSRDEKQSIKEDNLLKDLIVNEVIQNKDQQNSKEDILKESKLSSKTESNKHQTSKQGESKYLKSSQSRFVLTPQQKQKLLHKFNQQQGEMYHKLFESMGSISNQSLSNSQNYKTTKPNIKGEVRVFESQMCHSSNNHSDMLQTKKEKEIKQSEINFNPPQDQDIMEMTFLKKTYQQIVSVDPQRIMGTSSEEKPQIHKNDREFKKLEDLMRDREIKKSILDSNQAHSSLYGESFLQIVDQQTAQKFKKIDPDTFKKDEAQSINQ